MWVLVVEPARGLSGLGLGELGTLIASVAAAIATGYGLKKGRQSRQVVAQAKSIISTELEESRSLVGDLQRDNERIRKRLREVESLYNDLNNRVWKLVSENELLKSANVLLRDERSLLKTESALLKKELAQAARPQRGRSKPSPKRTGRPGGRGRSSQR